MLQHSKAILPRAGPDRGNVQGGFGFGLAGREVFHGSLHGGEVQVDCEPGMPELPDLNLQRVAGKIADGRPQEPVRHLTLGWQLALLQALADTLFRIRHPGLPVFGQVAASGDFKPLQREGVASVRELQQRRCGDGVIGSQDFQVSLVVLDGVCHFAVARLDGLPVETRDQRSGEADIVWNGGSDGGRRWLNSWWCRGWGFGPISG